MAQRSKGPRRQIWIDPLSTVTRRELAVRAAHQGIAFSQYISDVLAFAVGLPEFALALNQTALDVIEIPHREDIEPPVFGTPRVPLPVYEVISQISAARGITAADFVAEVCDAHIDGRPLPAVDVDGEEELLLTTA